MPTQEHRLQMLSMSNTLVGSVNNIKEPATKSKGYWDGDTLSNLGFTNIQVGGTSHDENHKNQDQGVSFVTKVWKVLGVHDTNPFKAKKKVKTNLKLHDVEDAPIIKAEEKAVFVKNYTKNLHLVVALASANSKSVKAIPDKSEDNRYTLDRRELYLNSCATYHSFFTKEFLWSINNGDTTLTGSCNAGTTVTNTGWW